MRTKQELFDSDGNSRGFYSTRNRVNDLTGKEWVFWTRSVITKVYPINCMHALRSQHGGQKPPDLCADIIRVFTKEGQTVLDPLMGVGGVLLGAALSGREATGIDLNPKWIDIYRQVCRGEELKAMECIVGDAERVLQDMGTRAFDFVFTDVPYWKMERAPRSKGAFKRVGETARQARQPKLGVFGDYEYQSKTEWLGKMARILTLCSRRLRPDGYLATFVGDMYHAGEYHSLSAELAAELSKSPDLVWKANIIWYDVSKSLHLYGYQYSYIPSFTHQNILVFRKEGGQAEKARPGASV